MKVKGRIWIEDENGDKLFGVGVYELLLKVKSGGSLSEAAKNMKMSYNKAHNLIKALESRVGFKVLDTKVGGSRGGGSSLTDRGEDLLSRYRKTMDKLNEDMEEAYELYFSDFQIKKED